MTLCLSKIFTICIHAKWSKHLAGRAMQLRSSLYGSWQQMTLHMLSIYEATIIKDLH
jgi:hypothetical protein